MAVDEALFEVRSNDPILRTYSWDRAAYSIGYFQSVDDTVKRFGCARKGVSVVRRPSGGGAVLHGQDLTFSLCVDESARLLPANVRESYLKVNEVLLTAFRKSFPGLDFTDCRQVPKERKGSARICFEEPSCYDLMLSGKKVVGSSQRRSGGRILHQCSIFLEGPRESLRRSLVQAFAFSWGADIYEDSLTDAESARADEIERTVYRSPDRLFLADSFLEKQSGQL